MGGPETGQAMAMVPSPVANRAQWDFVVGIPSTTRKRLLKNI